MENTRDDRYAIISQLIDEWYPTYGDWFTTEDVWRHITDQSIVLSVQGKKDIAIKLSREVDKGTLRRRGKKFKALDKSTIKRINPFDAPYENSVHLKWGAFPFDRFVVSEGDVIVLAGESNQGKSTLAMNLLTENCDEHKIFFVSTEATPGKFRNRLMQTPNVDPLKEQGKLKFEFATMFEGDNYSEIIEPDKINIIDWIGLRGNFYEIENVIIDIKARLKKGIAILVLQKKEGQDAPVGGEFAWRRADVCLLISKGILQVKKVKDYVPPSPNGKLYAFEIPDSVCWFQNIREVVKCTKCHAGRVKDGECFICDGTGYVDVYQSPPSLPATTWAVKGGKY